MQNLIKVDCSGFVVKAATYSSPLNSAWDDSDASGKLSASQTTSKVGTCLLYTSPSPRDRG